ncbi:ALBINO3-like protein 1, chloroplastic [Macadamia integrifolia]|uniref:ALBINO3-like protein 1, chloroplastic n=1 Tax=Macadamia integrifolia TaxID=60698 RepID=UPI001C4F41D5|nr:ALBINO3-like protein 1, chloroplastic [Macadamia integrifolia]
MATFFCLRPHSLFLSPTVDRPRHVNRLLHRSSHGFSIKKSLVPCKVGVVRSSLNPDSFTDLDSIEPLFRQLFGRAEGFFYTIADAAVSSSDSVSVSKQNGDWLSGITGYLESFLKVLKDGLSVLHVPYSYGFAIILLTVIVKAATFPLTKKQVESAMAMRSLQPQVKAIQQRYAGDQEKIQLETARLYKLASVNPLAGCLPTLATIPVWIGLYRALSNVADEGLLTEGFFWIPSLAGPTTVVARQSGSGISWLFPFIDGHPPLGWSDTLAYLVLPILLVISQYISVQIMQSSQANDPNLKSSQAVTKFLPLMIGYFALSVPSGLSLYWLTNNILSTAQQVWLQKLGGANNPVRQLSVDTTGEEQPKIQNSNLEVNSTKVEPKQVEKLTQEGPSPGERFKQIKEQEARRRRQREEQKMKAAAEGTETFKAAEEKEAKDANLVKTDVKRSQAELYSNGNEKVQSVNEMHDSSSAGVALVNGDHSILGSKEDHKKMTVSRMENGGLSVNYEVDGKDEQHLDKNMDKEAAVQPHSTNISGGKGSSEFFDDRRDQQSEREEA